MKVARAAVKGCEICEAMKPARGWLLPFVDGPVRSLTGDGRFILCSRCTADVRALRAHVDALEAEERAQNATVLSFPARNRG